MAQPDWVLKKLAKEQRIEELEAEGLEIVRKKTRGREVMIEFGKLKYDDISGEYWKNPKKLTKSMPTFEEYGVPEVLIKTIKLALKKMAKFLNSRTGKWTGKSVNLGAFLCFKRLIENPWGKGYILATSKTLKKNKESVMGELGSLIRKLVDRFNFDACEWDWSTPRANTPFFESVERPLEFSFGSFESSSSFTGKKIEDKPPLGMWVEEAVIKDDNSGVSAQKVVDNWTANYDSAMRVDRGQYEEAEKMDEYQMVIITQNHWRNGKEVHEFFFDDIIEQKSDEWIEANGNYQLDFAENGVNGSKTVILYANSKINPHRGKERIATEDYLFKMKKFKEYSELVWGREFGEGNILLTELEKVEILKAPRKYVEILGGVDFSFGKDKIVSVLCGLYETKDSHGKIENEIDLLRINFIDTRKSLDKTAEYLLPEGILKPFQKWYEELGDFSEEKHWLIFCDSQSPDRIATLNSLNSYIDIYEETQYVIPATFRIAKKFADKNTTSTSLHSRIHIKKDLMSFGKFKVLETEFPIYKKAIENSSYIIKVNEYNAEVIRQISGWGADIIDPILYSFSLYTEILLNTIRSLKNG
jgi:hypothetical protein